MSPKDAVTIEFPMVEETVKYTHVFDEEYTLHFKGNTLVDISPRDSNPTGYPIRETTTNGKMRPSRK